MDEKLQEYYGHYATRKRFGLGVRAKKYIARRIVGLVDLPPDAAVFELGPGDGDIAEIITSSGHTYAAMDASAGNVRALTSRGYDVVQGFAPPIAPRFAGRKFDVVFSMHVIEHMTIDGVLQFLAEVKASLKPGGSLVLVCPDASRWGIHFYDADYTHCLPFTARRLRQTVQAAGFRVEHEDLQIGPVFGAKGLPLSWVAKLGAALLMQDLTHRWVPNDLIAKGLFTVLPNLVLVAKPASPDS